MSTKNKYWAKLPSKELAQHCLDQNKTWSSTVGGNNGGMADVWGRNIRAYYANVLGSGSSDSTLDFMGQEGEIVKMLVPQARSLNTQFLSLTTKQKLSFDPEAQSTDSKTRADTRVAAALCEQITRAEHLDTQAYKMAEHATLTGLGYIMPSWDMMKGKPQAVDDEGNVVMSGDLDIFVPIIQDVVYDYMQEDFYKVLAVTVKRPRSRWDVIAKLPELEKEILSLPSISADLDGVWLRAFNATDDMIWEYHTIHRTSPAIQNGRYAVYYSPEVFLFDDENPYKDPDGNAFIPLVQMKPEPIVGCGFGYPFFSNILPMQEMLDHSFSAVASNQAAHAVQSILNPRGNDISVSNIGDLRFMQYTPNGMPGGGKPEPLQLTASSPETFKFMESLRNHMMEVYNINSALRGDPGAGITSGVAIATLSTNALEFSQNFSKAYHEALETCMTYCMWIYATFATEPMVVAITGTNDSTIAKEFTGKDLAPIKRVKINIGNPLMATAAGKFEVAQNLLGQGLISTPKKYFQILEGAPLKTLYGVDFDQDAFIDQENDDLRDGAQVFVMPIDNHAQHIQSHAALLNDTEIRRNGQMVDAVMGHILEHYQAAQQQDPMLAQMIATGQMPQMPPPGAGAPPPPGPGGPMAPPDEMMGDMPAEPAQSLLDPNQGAPGGITPPLAG